MVNQMCLASILNSTDKIYKGIKCMKRVIAASYVRKHPRMVKLKQAIRSRENDLDYLDTCYTLEDVTDHEYEVFNAVQLIRELEANAEIDSREIIEDYIEKLTPGLTYYYHEYEETHRILQRFYMYVNQLKSVIDIQLVDGQWARIPIGGRNPEDLIELVDLINDVLGSKYHGTGRGGSWTAYNIWTPDKVELKIGTTRDAPEDDNAWWMVPCGI